MAIDIDTEKKKNKTPGRLRLVSGTNAPLLVFVFISPSYLSCTVCVFGDGLGGGGIVIGRREASVAGRWSELAVANWGYFAGIAVAD